jgi:endonuclease III
LVKSAADPAKNLRSLLKKIGTVEPPEELPGSDDPLGVLVMSFLMWEASTEKAVAAFRRLMEGVVDYNALRVCMPHETVELIGDRYPKVLERCQRMRACLRDIYLREHSVDLSRLATCGKRDVRKFIESLEGMPPYVAARVLLLCYDTHAVPVDEQLRGQLLKASAADEELDVPDLAIWLSRQIKANVSLPTHYALQSWVEQQVKSSRGRTSKRSTKKTKTAAAKGTAKSKTTSSKTKKTTRRKTSGSGSQTRTA